MNLFLNCLSEKLFLQRWAQYLPHSFAAKIVWQHVVNHKGLPAVAFAYFLMNRFIDCWELEGVLSKNHLAHLPSPFYWWVNWQPESWSDLLKVIELASDRVIHGRQVFWVNCTPVSCFTSPTLEPIMLKFVYYFFSLRTEVFSVHETSEMRTAKLEETKSA